MCRLSCIWYDCCFALYVKGNVCSLFFIRWWWRAPFIEICFFVRCEVLVSNTREVRMLVCWYTVFSLSDGGRGCRLLRFVSLSDVRCLFPIQGK